LSDEDYREFYTSDLYRVLYGNSENIYESFQERYNNKDDEIFSILSPMMEKFDSKTVMEFGCGGGWNLLPFQNANYTVVGYDYSPILTELGKEYGLNLHQGSFSTLENSSILYDVIILNHVIEHFTNFNKNMNQILQYLKPDGLLYIGGS
jgi:2-polyprenyl-3-methyl-5-hydroxy-6-metoxy-1,4-benzoquinol methylase